MVADEYRRRGLGSRLDGASARGPALQPLARTDGRDARDPARASAGSSVAPLEVAQLLIRPEHVLKGKLPGPAALAAGLGLRATAAMRGSVRGKSTLCVKRGRRASTNATIGCGATWRPRSAARSCATRRT